MVGERGSPTNYSRSRQVAESRQKSELLTQSVHNLGHNLGHNSSNLLGRSSPSSITSTSVKRPTRSFKAHYAEHESGRTFIFLQCLL